MEAIDLLNGMMNDTTYITTRGTTGDADGTITVDTDLAEEFEYAEVVLLSELKEINDRAYEDMIDYITGVSDNTTEDDYFVIMQDDQYILAWN